MRLFDPDQVRHRAARAVRRGRRRVLLTPNPGPRFGNFLYYWLHAAIRRSAGEDYRVQVHPHLAPWLQELDDVRRELSVDTAGVGFFDRREWPPRSQFQDIGRDFAPSDLTSFVQQYLLRSHLLMDVDREGGEKLVVNVRRGDYYAVPRFRELYAYDVQSYVKAALERAVRQEPVAHIRVISDDLGWCRANLHTTLRSVARRVDYGGSTPGARSDFRALASARRLIGTNSTFSYWGAYVATVRHGSDARIQMPRFMSSRHPAGARQLLPEWDVVEDLPGGWALPVGKEA